MSTAHEQALDEATFVFDAEVIEVGASTAPNYTGQARTAVARITRVISSTPTLANTVGMLVTVELGSRERVQAGAVYEFSTYPRFFSDSIIAASAGHAAVGTTAQADVPVDPIEMRARRGLRTHANEADLIVTGRVTGVQLVPQPETAPRSDKDPEWREAVIKIGGVEKGKPPGGGEVLALFAASRHPGWREAPKLDVGLQGLFLLHTISREEAGGSTAKYACLDEWDVQPLSRLDEIRAQT
jgi:hypothetical protein